VRQTKPNIEHPCCRGHRQTVAQVETHRKTQIRLNQCPRMPLLDLAGFVFLHKSESARTQRPSRACRRRRRRRNQRTFERRRHYPSWAIGAASRSLGEQRVHRPSAPRIAEDIRYVRTIRPWCAAVACGRKGRVGKSSTTRSSGGRISPVLDFRKRAEEDGLRFNLDLLETPLSLHQRLRFEGQYPRSAETAHPSLISVARGSILPHHSQTTAGDFELRFVASGGKGRR